jgi:hypothetical protein
MRLLLHPSMFNPEFAAAAAIAAAGWLDGGQQPLRHSRQARHNHVSVQGALTRHGLLSCQILCFNLAAYGIAAWL